MACNTRMVDRCYCHIGNHGDVNWMISGKNDKSIKTPEKETEKLTSKYNSEISVISKAVEEPVELEFWGKRNGIDQFRVKVSLDGIL